MYKKYYQNYLATNPTGYNFSTTSEVDFPDFSYIESKIAMNDFDLYARATKLITKILNISQKSQVHFFKNTTDSISAILEIHSHKKKISLLTSDSELLDLSGFFTNTEIIITKIPLMPFDNFNDRLIQLIQKEQFDIIFLSQIFYNSGMILQNIDNILKYINFTCTQFILDGNRAFMHKACNLSQYGNEIFYIASARDFFGDDISILISPLDLKTNLNPASLMRVINVLELINNNQIKIEDIDSYMQTLQKNFRDELITIDHFYLAEKNIINIDYRNHGHFYTFALPSSEVVKKLVNYLELNYIKVDQIGSRLKINFKLYQDTHFDLSFLKNHRKI